MRNPWMIAFFALIAWVAISNGWINFGGTRIDPYSAAVRVEVRNPVPSVGVGDPRHPQVRFGNQMQFDGLLNESPNNQFQIASSSGVINPGGMRLPLQVADKLCEQTGEGQNIDITPYVGPGYESINCVMNR